MPQVPARHFLGQKKGGVTDEWLEQSRGGLTSEIHVCVEGYGMPLSLVNTAGQCGDAQDIGSALRPCHCPGQGECTRANDQPVDASTVLAAFGNIDNRSGSARFAALARNDSTCKKPAAQRRRSGSPRVRRKSVPSLQVLAILRKKSTAAA